MQGDLISRKSVMELIESKCTDGCLGTADTTLIDAHGLIDEVSDLPTAYDVEKVVEELECNREEFDRRGIIPLVNMDYAVKVVRNGGRG